MIIASQKFARCYFSSSSDSSLTLMNANLFKKNPFSCASDLPAHQMAPQFPKAKLIVDTRSLQYRQSRAQPRSGYISTNRNDSTCRPKQYNHPGLLPFPPPLLLPPTLFAHGPCLFNAGVTALRRRDTDVSRRRVRLRVHDVCVHDLCHASVVELGELPGAGGGRGGGNGEG